MLVVALLFAFCGVDDDQIHPKDVIRFGVTGEMACANWREANAHVRWASEHTNPEYYELAKYCQRAWDLLDDCARGFVSTPDRQRERLLELRAWIGKANYRLGAMPPVRPWDMLLSLRP